MNNSIAIVSGSDSRFFHLLMDLVNSIHDNASNFAFDFCLYDVGLTSEQRQQIDPYCKKIFDLDWCMDFPERDQSPNHHRLRVCKPFIPDHFPGYETYIWLDADMWVQNADVLSIYARAAKRGKFAITAQFDRAYKQTYKRTKLLGWTHNHKHYRLGFGWRIADQFGKMPILNSGAFAMPEDSFFWEAWKLSLQRALNKSRHPLMEQTAINYEVYRNFESATILPAYCNWLVEASSLWVDEESGMLVEPFEPHLPIGLIHFAGDFDIESGETLNTVQGNLIHSRLDYSYWKETVPNFSQRSKFL